MERTRRLRCCELTANLRPPAFIGGHYDALVKLRTSANVGRRSNVMKLTCPSAALWLAAFTSSALAGHSATIFVPADQPTIQAGIDVAANGDIVLVSPGTYHENTNFNGKAIAR
jgi:hypothetical protein